MILLVLPMTGFLHEVFNQRPAQRARKKISMKHISGQHGFWYGSSLGIFLNLLQRYKSLLMKHRCNQQNCSPALRLPQTLFVLLSLLCGTAVFAQCSFAYNLPLLEGFNSAGIPTCWTQQYVSGVGPLDYRISSTNPLTSSFEGSRFVFFNSYSYSPGVQTRLISPKISSVGKPNVYVEFYFMNENYGAYNSGPFLNEGVQVQYSLNGSNWIDCGPFFPRHDGTLEWGNRQWKRKAISLPADAANQPSLYIAFKFRSEAGNNTSIDAINITDVLQGCETFTNPNLFGQSQTAIFCKAEAIGFGVSNSVKPQDYYFTLFRLGGAGDTIKKAGPLDGNGGQLSIAARMQSAQDAGQYTVTAVNGCGEKASVNFTAFYGNIDNLRINSWGSNAVNFEWSASNSNAGSMTYEYAVTNIADPNSVSIVYSSTNNTSATVSGLVAGSTYYIHVRVSEASLNGSRVYPSFNCGSLPFQTLSFVACSSSSPSAGTVTPLNAVACVGGTAQFTASGGSTYQWYKEDNSPIAGATSALYNASAPGQYRVHITTGSTCQGITKSVTLTQTKLEFDDFSFAGGGSFYEGDTVRFWLYNSRVGQTYKILKNGVEVYAFEGIGKGFESKDTLWYKFVINSFSQAGTYHLQVSNVYCIAAIFDAATVNFLTSQTICPGLNARFTVPPGATGYTYQWQVNTGSGWADLANTAPYSGVNTNSILITAPPTSYYGYVYRCIATGLTTVISSTRTLKFGVTWSGSASNFWNAAGNWSGCGNVPDGNTDVIVPPGLARYPVVNVNASCRSIDVKTGATLTVAPGVTLTVTGK